MKYGCVKENRKIAAWLMALLLAAAVGLTGCSTDSYDDPDAEYMAKDATTMATVEPATVKTWVDNGCIIPETGQRVLILDCVPNPPGAFKYSDTESWFAGDAVKIKANMAQQYGEDSPQYLMVNMLAAGNLLGHIPGAIVSVSHEGYEITNRNDGPIIAEHEVGTGSLIDQMLRKNGITKDDVILLTTSRYDYPGFCPSRLWWTLRYWGFSRDHIRVLNGGNKAYAMYAKTQGVLEPLQKGVVMPLVTPSDISVVDLPKKFFSERISLGEVIALIDSGRTSLPDDDPNQVVILDTRQPPSAYFFKDATTTTEGTTTLGANGIPDIFEATINGYSWDAEDRVFKDATDPPNTLNLSQVLFTSALGLQIPFDAVNNPPMNLAVAPASTYLGIHMKDPANPAAGPLAIPLGAKPAAFEALLKGAKVVKSPAYNITVPAITEADGRYKSPEAMRSVFATAGIDGTKPIITYCNSGALASIYYYALKEVAGFDDVRLYDGSWQEWANLTAFEPVTTDYVVNDNFSVYPAYPAGAPKIQIFAGKNNYFTYDPTTDTLKDSVTGVEIGADKIKAGGQLAGNPVWDVITRSEYVVLRPTATVNDGNRSYVDGVNWPTVQTFPTYDGAANLIREEDEAYRGSTGGGGGSAPTPFVPTGGGC